MQVGLAHPHLRGLGFDLTAVRPHFETYVRQHGLSERIGFKPGDFFADPLPQADVLVMGHVLHDWNLDQKRALIAKAYVALPSGGALIVYETIIDDDRRNNAIWLAYEPQHADRDAWRRRLYGGGMRRVDAPGRLQDNARRTPRGPREHGRWNKVAGVDRLVAQAVPSPACPSPASTTVAGAGEEAVTDIPPALSLALPTS